MLLKHFKLIFRRFSGHKDDFWGLIVFRISRFSWKYRLHIQIRRLIKKFYGSKRFILSLEGQLTCQLSPEIFIDLWERLGAEKSHFKWNYGQNGWEHQNTPPLVSETPDIFNNEPKLMDFFKKVKKPKKSKKDKEEEDEKRAELSD